LTKKGDIGVMMNEELRMYGGCKDDEDVLLVSGCGDEKRGMLLNFHDEVKKHTLMM